LGHFKKWNIHHKRKDIEEVFVLGLMWALIPVKCMALGFLPYTKIFPMKQAPIMGLASARPGKNPDRIRVQRPVHTGITM
jgi:hypothetical protein